MDEEACWPAVACLVWGILRVKVSAEEQRVLEGVYSCEPSEIHGGSFVNTFVAHGFCTGFRLKQATSGHDGELG